MHHQHMNSVHLTELQQKYIICPEIKIQSVCNLFNTLSGIPALTFPRLNMFLNWFSECEDSNDYSQVRFTDFL